MYGTNATKPRSAFGLSGVQMSYESGSGGPGEHRVYHRREVAPPMHSCAVYGIVPFAGHSRRL